MRSTVGAGLLVCLVGLAPVRADEPPGDEHYRIGTRKFALGQYAEAAAEYERSFEGRPTAAALYNVAQMHRLAGNKKHAIEVYRHYLILYGVEIANREEVERHIEDLQRAISSEVQAATAPPSDPASPQLAPPPPPPALPSPPQVSPPSIIVAPATAGVPTGRWKLGLALAIGGVLVVAGAATGIGIAATSGGPPATPLGAFTVER